MQKHSIALSTSARDSESDEIEVRLTEGQIEDLLHEVNNRAFACSRSPSLNPSQDSLSQDSLSPDPNLDNPWLAIRDRLINALREAKLAVADRRT